MQQVRSKREERERIDAGRLGRSRYRKQLDELLGIADDEAFIQLVWSIARLQAGATEVVKRLIQFPTEAVGAPIGSKYYVSPWDVETLVNELLASPKLGSRKGRLRRLNCREFGAIAGPVNTLHRLENAESAFSLRRMSVLAEMPRIAHRQFPWQAGYFNHPQFYKWHYVFGGRRCRQYFRDQTGVELADFALVGFAAYGHFESSPILRPNVEVREIGLTAEMAARGLKLLVATHADARTAAIGMRRNAGEVAYRRSVLRDRPILRFANRLRAPLIELIVDRTTAGVYYDLVGGPSDLRNEIASRFEAYAHDFLQRTLSNAEVAAGYEYGPAGRRHQATDVLVRQADGVQIAVECKSKKMTFEARFSERPLHDAQDGFEELVKGVFQLWRFFSHARRGVVLEKLRGDVIGVVLTLDTWLVASVEFEPVVLQRAKEMARMKDPAITAEDMKPIVFCPMQDLEMTLSAATEVSFFRALQAATTREHRGWALWSVHQHLGTITDNPYPFTEKLADVLPWWGELQQLAAASGDDLRRPS